MIDDRWRTLPCSPCGGHGVVPVYSAFDFEGPGECSSCGGMGRVFIRPSGHLFLWPGGPAAGKTDASEYEQGAPYRIPREEA